MNTSKLWDIENQIDAIKYQMGRSENNYAMLEERLSRLEEKLTALESKIAKLIGEEPKGNTDYE